MTETATLAETPPKGRGRRWLSRGTFLLVVCVCAVVPWLVPWPWQQPDVTPESDPSAIIHRAHSQRVTGRADSDSKGRAPTVESVRQVSTELAASKGGYDQPVSAEAMSGVKTTPGQYQKLGRIEIPRIRLKVSFGEGVYAKTLAKGPGHWPGTPMPGQAGNSVLSGHRNTYTRPFQRLDALKKGDKIVVTTGKLQPVTYHVVKTTIVPEARYADFVLRQPKDSAARELTVFACHPAGNPIFRIVVQATAEAVKRR